MHSVCVLFRRLPKLPVPFVCAPESKKNRVRIRDTDEEKAGIPARAAAIRSPFRLCLVAAAPAPPPPREWRR
jgi:hypothetical protein